MAVHFSGEGCEDLRGVPDRSVMAELLVLARNELALERVDPISGPVAGYAGIWWRRAIRAGDVPSLESFAIDDSDEFTCQACDYVFVYRQVTQNERITHRLGEVVDETAGLAPLRRRTASVLVVVRVLTNEQMWQLFLG